MRRSLLTHAVAVGMTAAVALAMWLPMPRSANAQEVWDSLCTSGQCANIKIRNNASATVVSTKITQEKTDGACAKVEFKNGTNLTGAMPSQEGEAFTMELDTTCQYKIKFSTTDGCTGDKTGHIYTKNYGGVSEIYLDGGCGTLKVKKK